MTMSPYRRRLARGVVEPAEYLGTMFSLIRQERAGAVARDERVNVERLDAQLREIEVLAVENGLHPWRVTLPNDDKAEADDVLALLFASNVLIDESAGAYGAARELRRDCIVTFLGQYAARETELARHGWLSPDEAAEASRIARAREVA